MTVLALGGFDLLHWGHIRFLRQAAQFGHVTVGLTTDTLLEATKRRPVLTYEDRRRGLEELGVRVIPRDTPSAAELVAGLGPSVFACGSDWVGADHLEAAGLSIDFLNRHAIILVYLPRNHEMSTTRIIERVQEGVSE